MGPECQSMEVLLSQYEAGELSVEADVAWVRAHLAECEPCRGVLASFERLSVLCAEEEAPSLGEARAEAIWSRLKEGRGVGGASVVTDSEILTLEEAAAFLKVSMSALESELDTLPVFEFAGHVRIRRQKLMAWIEAREKRDRDHRLFKIVSG